MEKEDELLEEHLNFIEFPVQEPMGITQTVIMVGKITTFVTVAEAPLHAWT